LLFQASLSLESQGAAMMKRYFPMVLALAVAVLATPALGQSARRAPAVSERLLETHNRERSAMHVSPLVWSERLAAEARVWAQDLARRGAFAHSTHTGGAGENLWMGTAGAYAPEEMIGSFIEEKADFRAGRFPDVSRTGNWVDIGHYSQLIWRGTREVGCALATGRGNDVLVCRYWPAGNVMGQPVP
jgi:hypothetical protein